MTKQKKSVAERIKGLLAVGEDMLVSDIRRKLGVKREEVEEATYGSDCLDLIVGIRTGAGYGCFGKRGYRIERYQ
jgi:hypothetical protein